MVLSDYAEVIIYAFELIITRTMTCVVAFSEMSFRSCGLNPAGAG